jgi:hypothetical protein
MVIDSSMDLTQTWASVSWTLSLLCACSTSGPSPGPVTCVDFDVLLPVKLQEKVAPVIDSLLDDKQVRQCPRVCFISRRAGLCCRPFTCQAVAIQACFARLCDVICHT